MKEKKRNGRQAYCRPQKIKKQSPLTLHPLFFAVGIFYACKGELFLFLLSFLVAVQHECAHAFASAKLGYRLNKIVLMPFGAVIDGDMRGLSIKDEIIIALWGPLCNLFTAGFFAALWWFAPTMYAFTDTACFSSLSIALVNLLPAYPLDGGRILRCLLVRAFAKTANKQADAERKAGRVASAITLCFSTAFLVAFIVLCVQGKPNISLLTFSLFLLFGVLGSKERKAVYERIDFSCGPLLKRGVELKRVAIASGCPVKDAFRFLSRGYFLVLEVYDEDERRIFEISQNELSQFFAAAKTPYEPLGEIYERLRRSPKSA